MRLSRRCDEAGAAFSCCQKMRRCRGAISAQDLLSAYVKRSHVIRQSGDELETGFIAISPSDSFDAGFVIFGKTNIPECGLLAVSEPAAFKPAMKSMESRVVSRWFQAVAAQLRLLRVW